jgi:hypothetical protein
MKRWRVALTIGILAVSSALLADDCAEANTAPQKLGRTFKLTVVDSNHAPRKGLKVSLGTRDRYQAMHPIASGTTDADGVLNFVKVQPGNFALQIVDNSTGERQYKNVQIIVKGGDAGIEFPWPSVNWLSLRSASGYLMNYSEPMRHWSVTLEGFPDGNELAFADTDIAGKFDLPARNAGLYWLEFAQANRETGLKTTIGRVPVNLTLDERYPAADAIFVSPNACGLAYDQYCTLPPEALKASCIHTVDSKGTAIPSTATLVSLRGATTPVSIPADKDGYVKLPAISGDYELRIFAKNYTPIRQKLSLATSPDTSCNNAVVLTLNPFGASCKAAPQGKGN